MIKRALDLLIAVAALPFVLPLMALAAVGVRLKLGSPIFFSQPRAGLNGRPFRIWKLRSMSDARDADGELLADALRTPPFGHFIRRFRLDELPSLFSVLRGDISMVGPRPLTPHVRASVLGGTARLAVRPGFTGLAQVSGNTLLSDEEKVAVDLYYIRHRSMLLDLDILLRTVATVVLGERRRQDVIGRALAEWDGTGAAAHA